MSIQRRPNLYVQDKDRLEASTVAAIAATTTLPLGTMDGDYIVDKFEIAAPGGYTSDAANYYDISLQQKAQTFVATAATDTCAAAAHGYATGDAVQVTNSGGGLPAGLTAGVTYFAVKVDADNFKVSDTNAHALAGTNIVDITTAGTGTQSVAKVLALYSLIAVTGNGDLVTNVFAPATRQPNSTGFSGQQLNAVLTKFAAAANVPAGTRLIAHCRQF